MAGAKNLTGAECRQIVTTIRDVMRRFRVDLVSSVLEYDLREAEWLGLTIVATEQGGEQDDTGMVEFIARHKTEGVEVAHHERSQFRKLDGAWRFVSGTPVKQVPVTRGDKTGRNDPCPCGSGKKYKKCHGA